jgi:outer membrane protein assembly factor BamA
VTRALASPAPPAEPASPAGPISTPEEYSPYEQESVDAALANLGTRIEASPEGKTVEGIDVVTLDVIEPRDPVPAVLNVLHTTTRRHVIEREVLMREGDPYQRLLCDETARNLRTLPQLSLVLCAATKGSAPDRVRVLVITKDVWSLRLGWDVAFFGNGLQSLTLLPTESNLAGTHQVAFLHYLYQPQTQTLGLGYQVPRIAGTRLALSTEVDVTWNRQGHAEGSTGTIGVSTPLYSSRTEWAWGAGSTWSDAILRRYVNADVANYNAPITPERDAIPWQYRSRRFSARSAGPSKTTSRSAPS